MLGFKLYAQLCGTKSVHCVIKELECLFNAAKQLVEGKVLSGFSDLVLSVQQGPIVSLVVNVHPSRGLSTLHSSSWLTQEVGGVSLGGQAAGQHRRQLQCRGGCARRASPPSCHRLGTLHKCKGRGQACGFLLVFF